VTVGEAIRTLRVLLLEDEVFLSRLLTGSHLFLLKPFKLEELFGALEG
jgi:hypothetical protein